MREVYLVGIFSQPDVKDASRAAMGKNRMIVSSLNYEMSIGEENEEKGILVEGLVVTSEITVFEQQLMIDLRQEIRERKNILMQSVSILVKSTDRLREHQLDEVPIHGNGILSTYFSDN